jgi:hypothetical protein
MSPCAPKTRDSTHRDPGCRVFQVMRASVAIDYEMTIQPFFTVAGPSPRARTRPIRTQNERSGALTQGAPVQVIGPSVVG